MHESRDTHYDSEPVPIYLLEKEESWQDEAELLERIVANLDSHEIPRDNILLTAHGETDDTQRTMTFALTLDEYAGLIDRGGEATLLTYAATAHQTDSRYNEPNEALFYDIDEDSIDLFDDYDEDIAEAEKAYISVYDKSKLLEQNEASLYESLPGKTIRDARICTFDVTSWL